MVITHRVHPDVLDLLGQSCEVVANQTRNSLSRAELLADPRRRCAAGVHARPDRRGVATTHPPLDGCGRGAQGYDNIDVAACTARGIWVTYVEDLLTAPTADLAVGLLLALDRHMLAGDSHVRSVPTGAGDPSCMAAGCRAARSDHRDGRGGTCGSASAVRVRNQLVYTDPSPLPAADEREFGARSAPLETLLASSSAVVVTAPLTAQTRHLLGTRALRQLPDRARWSTWAVVRWSTKMPSPTRWSRPLGGYAADVFAFEDWSDRPAPDHSARPARPRPHFVHPPPRFGCP